MVKERAGGMEEVSPPARVPPREEGLNFYHKGIQQIQQFEAALNI
jgi:hypothetical protein